MKKNIGSGDNGQTLIRGNKRIAKDSLRMDTIGAVDELNAVIGCAVAFIREGNVRAQLRSVQEKLLIVGNDLASQLDLDYKLKPVETVWLEETMRGYASVRKEDINRFVLAGGSKVGSFLHLARTIARRAERKAFALSKAESINKEIPRFLNRLSDFLFELAVFVDNI